MISPASPAITPPMKARHSVSRDNMVFTAVLILLATLVIILWFKDPAHRYTGESRVGWPPPPHGKP